MSVAEDLWWDVEKRAFQAYLAEDVQGGIDIITEFLKFEMSSPFRDRALGDRAELLLALGKIEEAKADLERALEVGEDASYARFTNEFALGVLYEQLGDHHHAVEYLLRALETALQEGKTSTGGVLVRLSKLINVKELSPETRGLIEKATRHSWRLLNLPGEPDLLDIQRSATVLLNESSRPH